MAGQHGNPPGADPVRILHLGASGRLGRMVARAWRGPAGQGLAVVAQARRAEGAPAGAVIWSPLEEPVPAIGPIDVVVDLAGVTGGDEGALALNVDLARAALAAGERLGARAVLLPSSAAVYGAGPFGEDADPSPRSAYGRAKRAMERAAVRRAATCLRIGNVVGADALVGGNPGGVAAIDRWPDGRGPRRSYLGPEGLARVLGALARRAAAGLAMPAVLNVAAPEAVAMEALAEAAGIRWSARPAPPGAIAEVALPTARLEALAPGAAGPADPRAMVAEWRRVGDPAAPVPAGGPA